jgi:WD40 repeat protein
MSTDRSIIVWDTHRHSVKHHLHSKSIVYFLGVTPDGSRVIHAADHTLSVWDLETGQELASLTLDGMAGIGSIALAANKPRLLAGDKTGALYCLDVHS